MIHFLMIFFGVITVGSGVAVLHHFRRRPIVWLMARHERERAFHTNAATATEAALAAERGSGNAAHAARLEASLAAHHRSVAAIDAAREFPERARG